MKLGEWPMRDPFSFEARINNRGRTLFVFSLFVTGHLLVIFSLLYFLFPRTWERETGLGIISIGLTFLSFHLISCVGEYFFHRNVLHDIIGPFKVFFRKHGMHHFLTTVSWDKDNSDLKIHSCYAIEKIEQDISATFPLWALAAFLMGIAPLLIIISWLLPNVPVLLAGFSAITLSYYLYEVLHVMHHQPPLWWHEKFSKRFLGKTWQAIYSFHNCHHANTRCNLNVAGFFGLPLADWIFGTYRNPPTLLLHGSPVDNEVISDLTSRTHWIKAWLKKRTL